MAAFPATTRAAKSAQPTTGKQPARGEVNSEVNAGVSNLSKETITGSKRMKETAPGARIQPAENGGDERAVPMLPQF